MYGLTEIIAMNQNRERYHGSDCRQKEFNPDDFRHIPPTAFNEELKEHYWELGLDLKDGLHISFPIPNTPYNKRVAQLGKALELKAGMDTYQPEKDLHNVSWEDAKKLVEDGYKGRLLTAALYWPIAQWSQKWDPNLSQSLRLKTEWLDNVVVSGGFAACTTPDFQEGYFYGIPYGHEHGDLDISKYPGLTEAKTLIIHATDTLSGLPSRTSVAGLLPVGSRLYHVPPKHTTTLVKQKQPRGVELKFVELRKQPPGIGVRIITDDLDKLNL